MKINYTLINLLKYLSCISLFLTILSIILFSLILISIINKKIYRIYVNFILLCMIVTCLTFELIEVFHLINYYLNIVDINWYRGVLLGCVQCFLISLLKLVIYRYNCIKYPHKRIVVLTKETVATYSILFLCINAIWVIYIIVFRKNFLISYFVNNLLATLLSFFSIGIFIMLCIHYTFKTLRSLLKLSRKYFKQKSNGSNWKRERNAIKFIILVLLLLIICCIYIIVIAPLLEIFYPEYIQISNLLVNLYPIVINFILLKYNNIILKSFKETFFRL